MEKKFFRNSFLSAGEPCRAEAEGSGQHAGAALLVFWWGLDLDQRKSRFRYRYSALRSQIIPVPVVAA